tara:strand:+ start:527 stop:829 length:303 start_codon:yes stop_codon:yes gene_type:complete
VGININFNLRVKVDNIIDLFEGSDYHKVEYIFNGDVITGITHSSWPFAIIKNGNQRAFVCKETNEPFGKLMKDDFNTILMCWLLIDDSELIKKATNHESN